MRCPTHVDSYDDGCETRLSEKGDGRSHRPDARGHLASHAAGVELFGAPTLYSGAVEICTHGVQASTQPKPIPGVFPTSRKVCQYRPAAWHPYSSSGGARSTT
jgi:hypothetical protein